jgi:hypothetical protein
MRSELITETGLQACQSVSTCNHFGPSGQATTDLSMLTFSAVRITFQITVTRFSMLWSFTIHMFSKSHLLPTFVAFYTS